MARILLVDDDADVQHTLSKILATGGHDVLLGRQGNQALEDVERLSFDLLVTDVVMREVDGWRLIRALRTCKPGAAVIAISGGAKALEPDVALRLSAAFGAHGILRKPIRRDALLRMVADVLARRAEADPASAPSPS